MEISHGTLLAIQLPSGVNVGLTPPLIVRDTRVTVFITINSDAEEPEGVSLNAIQLCLRLAARNLRWLPASFEICCKFVSSKSTDITAPLLRNTTASIPGLLDREKTGKVLLLGPEVKACGSVPS